MRTIQLVTALALVATISGCASTSLRQSWGSALTAVTPGKSKQSVLQSEAVRTPLSDEFKQAQRNLKNPESLLVMHARLMEDQEKFAEARQRYREVITAYPRNVEAAVGLARVEHKTGRVEQAEQILTELQEMHPSSVPVRMALGSLYKERGQLEDAVRTYATAADLEPENQNLRYELGIALALSERYDEAMPHLQFAVGKPAATYNIGYLLHEAGKQEAALRWFEAALEGYPDEHTKAQATRMIAQLTPPAETEQHATQVANADAAAAIQNRPVRTASTTGSAARLSPRIVPASHETSLQPAGTPVRRSVFGSASLSVPVTQSSQSTQLPAASTMNSSPAPAQWHAKDAPQAAPVSAAYPQPTQSTAQQPPMWRSRQR